MTPEQLNALRFLPFLAEATAMLGTSWLLKRWMQPPPNFGGRYWRSLLASIASLPVALVAVVVIGMVTSLIYQSAGGQYENFSGTHIATFMFGTLGRAFVIWPFVIAWLVIKPHQYSPATAAPLAPSPSPSQATELRSALRPPPSKPQQSAVSPELEETPAKDNHSFMKFNRTSKIILVLLTIITIAGLAAYATYIYPVKRAENTKIRNVGLYGFSPEALSIKSASGMTMPYFEVDCSKPKYHKGWRGKLETSQSLNYWARKANAAEAAFFRFEDDHKPKAAELVAKDIVSYWTTVWYLSDELECYDVSALDRGKPY